MPLHSFRLVRAIATLASITPAALAQSYRFDLDAGTSSTSILSAVRQALPGTAIGNYDAVNNPTGTITCTNIFGACTNASFTMDGALLVDADFSGAPGGGFVATIDTQAGVALISDLDVSALGKSPGTAGLTLELTYQTFRTLQPTALFVGGFTLPLPLGQAQVDNLRIQQTGPAVPGVLTPTGVVGQFDFNALVPAEISFDLDVLGTQTPVGPVPFPLPLIGSLDVVGAAPLFTLFVDQKNVQSIPDPLPGQVIDDFALDVPTILPPGGVAHLLLDATFGALDFESNVSLSWYAAGAPVCEVATYCSSLPNTYSSGAHMQSAGTTSLAFNAFTLLADGVPPQHAGRFCMGTQQTFTPFGDGNLCVAGTFRRLPVVFADSSGVASYAVDFTDLSQPSSLINAGSTWNFQLIFRDPLGGPLTFNTSDAISATFCP
jgi:hypothetical protein